MFDRLQAQIEHSPQFARLLDSISRVNPGAHVPLARLWGSSLGFLLSSLSNSLNRQIFVVAPERVQAEQVFDDIGLLHGDSVRLLNSGTEYFGQLIQIPSRIGSMTALGSLLESRVDVVVAPFDFLPVRLPDPNHVRSKNIKLEVGKDTPLDGLVRQLKAIDFDKKEFIASPGEYSQRGGILDVFSHSSEHPVRVEFFGDAIESIREFDPVSQRSIQALSIANITPGLFSPEFSRTHATTGTSVFDYLDGDAIVFLIEPEVVWKQLEDLCARNIGDALEIGIVHEHINRFVQLHLGSFAQRNGCIDFNSSPQPSFNGNIQLLREHLLELRKNHVQVFIACDGQTELNRLRELVTERSISGDITEEQRPILSEDDFQELQKVEFVHHAIHAGFQLHDLAVACYAEHQIFGRQKRRGKGHKARVRGFSQKELDRLRSGDFVVHEDFGVGRFDGLKKIRVRDVEQEVMKLQYEEKDTLYVNLNYLNKVKKYSSKEGHIPRLTRLGTQEWDRLKAKAKKRIQDIARDLIRLYAQRKTSAGHPFQRDSTWQKELEASFIYEDTFDQAKATLDVKHDMEQPFPMDRLVCGDVGFGKTEVAVRAAFKAVLDGKQVAVLVPTTILAIQHHNTFVDRTSRFSVRVAVISRLKSKREQVQVLEQLKSGAVDIVIGTHRLLSKDVNFKDLGLLIIDEEHRFGVAAKEKLRHLRATVDTLTLTATPIPRTLHFSLLGARDLSIIATPPRNRIPIVTEISHYNEDLIKEVVLRETNRDGQVFFVHYRVSDIELWANKLRALFPSLKIRHAHGQMHAHELEKVMLEFQERKLDVLVCTKIIESGLDIPNVNTIIINRADHFGMSELYQLKGRVGRSNVQAYAYLIIPPVSVLPRTTIQRLQAIEEFSDLGSGFNLAMKDLEIRGAGNLLGAEQSGYIESMGFETYNRVLDEAVRELKEREFKELFPGEGESKRKSSETVIEMDLEALIPGGYIESDMERLEIYRRMYAVSTHEQLLELGEELKDRFGPHPVQVSNLLSGVQVRLVAGGFGFKKIWMGKERIEIEFPPESDTVYYESPEFQSLMEQISDWKSRGMYLKQADNTLKLILRLQGDAQPPDPIAVALKVLNELGQNLK